MKPLLFAFLPLFAAAQNVGIGATTPQSRLHVRTVASGAGMKTMNYTALIPVLVPALKEHQALVQKLENRLAQLEKKRRR